MKKTILRALALIGLSLILIGCGNSRPACDAYSDVPVEADSIVVNG
jgi:uncharacterized lipoprotein NlpE involved in copper resistance